MTKMYTTLRHPERYVWDFWYHYDRENRVFHVFYLNADPSLVPSEQHHFSAHVGYATTTDFTHMNWMADDVLCADPSGWDNTSIWTGDVIKIGNGFLLFYTSRDANVDDGFTQNIGCAFAEDITDWQSWQRIPDIQIKPTAPYQTRSVPGDTTIHAWRDPFLFVHDKEIHMLLAAKSTDRPVGRLGAIAMLKLRSTDFCEWDVLKPLTNPGWYSEMEVPQLYLDNQSKYRLVYSTWAKGDFSPENNNQGGLHSIRLGSSLETNRMTTRSDVLLAETSGLYAGRILPELGGEIVGFDVVTGGIRRSGIKTGFSQVNRDFLCYKLT